MKEVKGKISSKRKMMSIKIELFMKKIPEFETEFIFPNNEIIFKVVLSKYIIFYKSKIILF